MQSSCIGSLMELAQNDERILYLTADSGEGGLDAIYRMNFPERSFDFGISESNMVAAAAGLASAGKIPFVYTAAPFLCYRAYEFIRNDVCLQNLPVKLIGVGSGITTSALGPTHHTTEDIAVLRALPNLKIISPATPKQAFESIKVAYELDGPVYLRLGMNGGMELFEEDYQIVGNKMDVIKEGDDVSIFTTGSIIEEAMEAADILAEDGISVSVINVPTIKPIDTDTIIYQSNHSKLVCCVEEHNVIGGLGSIIAEVLFTNRCNTQFVKIGLDDCFASGYGQIKQLRKENKIDAVSIVNKIRELLKK